MRQLTLLRTLCLAVFCSFFLVACDWGASEETIAKNYLTAIAKGDMDKAIRMIYMPPEIAKNPDEQGKYKENLFTMFDSMKRNFFDANGGIQSIEFPDKSYAEDKRQVNLRYVITFGNGSSRNGSINLVLENKTWRVRAR